MKNVNSAVASYLQINHEVKKILEKKGVIVLPIVEAWKRYPWVKKYVKEKPEEGYFIWVKKQVDFPISTGVYITADNVEQKMTNLTVIEPGIKARGMSLCSSASDVNSIHSSKGIVVLKRNSRLDMLSVHNWHHSLSVDTSYTYILEENSVLNYTFRNLKPPKKARYETVIMLDKHANAKTKSAVNGVDSEIELNDQAIINGKGSSAIIEIRVVGRKDSSIKGITKAVAKEAGKAHLDCSGLLVDKKSSIKLIPELDVQNKNAILTHEASIGRIADEQLYYLRSRGLKEKEAIDLIVSGFLGV